VEVCVADNGSTDESVSWLQAHCPDVRLIVLDKNYGFADGYNKALEQVEAEYVVLLNSDVEVTPRWLEPMVAYMDAHSEVAACQPKIRAERNKEFFEYAGAAGGYLDKYGYPFCRGRIFDVVEKDKGQYDTVAPIFWATGAALFIRLKDYRDAGGLDGRFFAHMEEIDLCWRLRSRGRGIVCIPQSVVYHVGAATLKKENPRKTFLNFRNNLLMLRKNLPVSRLFWVMVVRFFMDYLAALQMLLIKQVANAWSVVQARWEYQKMKQKYPISGSKNRYAVSQLAPRSIVFDFYLRKMKK
jgi:GT2 family glycosyltransferase